MILMISDAGKIVLLKLINNRAFCFIHQNILVVTSVCGDCLAYIFSSSSTCPFVDDDHNVMYNDDE